MAISHCRNESWKHDCRSRYSVPGPRSTYTQSSSEHLLGLVVCRICIEPIYWIRFQFVHYLGRFDFAILSVDFWYCKCGGCPSKAFHWRPDSRCLSFHPIRYSWSSRFIFKALQRRADALLYINILRLGQLLNLSPLATSHTICYIPHSSLYNKILYGDFAIV